MRIGQLIDQLTVGGAQRLQLTFARAMRGRRVNLTVITLHRSRHGALATELASLGARVVELHSSSLADPLRFLRLVRFLRRERFDVLFTHLTSANLLGPVAGCLAGVPTVATLHASSRQTSRTREALESWILRRMVACCVAVGTAVAEAQRDRVAPTTCVVIPNPVEDIPPLPPAERLALRRRWIGGHEVMLVTTGMLRPVKGLVDLLAAFAELRRSHPEAALVLAGAGPLEGELGARIDELGLSGHAHLIGLCEDVPRLLAAADVYVSASHREGLPLGVLEAMAAGLPVVATAVGDLRYAVTEGTGLLVPPRDPPALAAALKRLLDEPSRARALGEAARRHIGENYRVDRWVDRLLELGTEVGRRAGARLDGQSPER